MTFFIILWRQKKILFLHMHVYPNFTTNKTISKCKNDKTLKNQIEKCQPLLLRRPILASDFHPLFLFFQILPGGNYNLLPPLRKGSPNYVYLPKLEFANENHTDSTYWVLTVICYFNRFGKISKKN